MAAKRKIDFSPITFTPNPGVTEAEMRMFMERAATRASRLVLTYKNMKGEIVRSEGPCGCGCCTRDRADARQRAGEFRWDLLVKRFAKGV